MCNRLDRIPACDGQTETQTDKRTDILPRHSTRYTYASRGKNYISCVILISEYLQQFIYSTIWQFNRVPIYFFSVSCLYKLVCSVGLHLNSD